MVAVCSVDVSIHRSRCRITQQERREFVARSRVRALRVGLSERLVKGIVSASRTGRELIPVIPPGLDSGLDRMPSAHVRNAGLDAVSIMRFVTGYGCRSQRRVSPQIESWKLQREKLSDQPIRKSERPRVETFCIYIAAEAFIACQSTAQVEYKVRSDCVHPVRPPVAEHAR